MRLIASPAFEAHVTPPGHPERMERAHVLTAAAERWRGRDNVTIVPPRPAARIDLLRVHDEAHVAAMAATAGRAVMLDADTFTSPESYDTALLAAGAAVQAAQHALELNEPAFALVRPPGHHAERDRAMGFCLFNNIAVAAAEALALGIDRVAIVDIDVHHGNGTQAMFYDDPRVLYVSTHQYPFYPGTGAATEIGAGAGAGFTVNIPLEAGATDADYDLVYRAVVAPILREFDPGLLLVSAGYDAHERDPLASMRVTGDGYEAIVGRVLDAAPGGRVAFVTEGGYDLQALATGLDRSFGRVLAHEAGGAAGGGAVGAAGGVHGNAADAVASRGLRALEQVRAALGSHWRNL